MNRNLCLITESLAFSFLGKETVKFLSAVQLLQLMSS